MTNFSAAQHPVLEGKPQHLLIGGRWVDSLSGGIFQRINPSTSKPLTEVSFGQAEDIDRAALFSRAG